jgi:hypothetical protein
MGQVDAEVGHGLVVEVLAPSGITSASIRESSPTTPFGGSSLVSFTFPLST